MVDHHRFKKRFAVRFDWMACLLLVILTLAVYWRVTGFDFINFDDDQYVTKNPVIQKGVSA